QRVLVRIALQRSTIHLVTGRDALAMRPLLQPVTERMTRSTFVRKLRGVDLGELAEAGRALVERAPMTFSDLGRELAARWPGNDAHALSQVVRWLVRRYLAAFGPATVMDVQTWSGLTRLGEVVEPMDLRRYRDERGRTLYDLPELDRPSPDVPAPVRLMYDFDNVFLSHADRSRVLGEKAETLMKGFMRANVQPRIILVDGFPAGDWTVTRAGGVSTLNLHRWEPIADLDAVAEEGWRLLELLAHGDEHAISVFDGPSRA
ncbi:MAG TPA: winged helix DNA-binding domain-containing protein, partial [Nonomuraea sp.]|nr:winged helix DNA-binding domain-containing protein [Nonomuraea sp.]